MVSNSLCKCGSRNNRCGCRPANSGSPAADEITEMETLFDNMMDPFMPIYQCVNFVCKGRNCNYSYAEKCRAKPLFRRNRQGKPIKIGCTKNCDSDNILNPFENANNNFDNLFNFNSNNLAARAIAPSPNNVNNNNIINNRNINNINNRDFRACCDPPLRRPNTIQPLPFPNNARPRCQAGANNNAINEFDREADRFDNRFIFGRYHYQ